LERKFAALLKSALTFEWRALMVNAGARGRPVAPLVLSAQERAYLERQVRRHRVARSHLDMLPASDVAVAKSI
jgi:hypothetical protein